VGPPPAGGEGPLSIVKPPLPNGAIRGPAVLGRGERRRRGSADTGSSPDDHRTVQVDPKLPFMNKPMDGRVGGEADIRTGFLHLLNGPIQQLRFEYRLTRREN